jgi:hypothetical protein
MTKSQASEILAAKFGLPYEAHTASNLLSASRSVGPNQRLVVATLDHDLGWGGTVFYGCYRKDEAEAVAKRVRRNRTVRVICVDIVASSEETF